MSKKKCFVIGPMSAAHMKALEWLANDVIQEILGDTYIVNTPNIPETGNIMNQVIKDCDRAQLVIADTTNNNPNVLYEMAVLDALGRACVPIKMTDIQDEDQSKMPFDRAQYRYLSIKSFSTVEAIKALKPYIEGVIKKIDSDELFSNPLTDFYGVPLSAFSAANGLARGYYNNFVKFAIQSTIVDGPEDLIGQKVRTLECKVPHNLDDATRGSVNELLENGTFIEVSIEALGRKINAYVPGNYDPSSPVIVDIPTCIGQLRTNVINRIGIDGNHSADSDDFQAIQIDEIDQFIRYFERLQNFDDSEQGRQARRGLKITRFPS